MESDIIKNLQPEFEPVAVVWSDTIPGDARQFKKGRFGCILYLFAEASRCGKVAGGNRETIKCHGGRAALGLGVDFDAPDEQLDRFAAVFGKGMRRRFRDDILPLTLPAPLLQRMEKEADDCIFQTPSWEKIIRR